MSIPIRRTLLAALGVLVVVGALPASAQQARSITGDAADGSQSPFRGSTLVYEHQATAISALRSAEPQWNPYYAHLLSLRPEWHPRGFPIFFRARVNLTQELTSSDDFNSAHEVVLSDMQLEAVAPGWTEPTTKIRIGGNLRVVAPLSKASWAQTLVTAVSPATTLTRVFSVPKLAGPIIVGYNLRLSKNFNRSTTPVMDGPRIPCTDPDSALCARLSHNGGRNVSWSVAHGPLVVVSPIEPLSLTFSFSQFRSALYDLTPAEVSTMTGPVQLDEGNGVNARWSNFALLDATYTLTPEFSLAVGAYTFSSQLGPDGTYRNPLVNRFTSLYVDLLVDMERLTHRLLAK